MIYNILDLFSGIGGFSKGLEDASPKFRTVAFCETELFPRRVLAKHWPDVPVFGDIRLLNAAILGLHGVPSIGAVVGGFPCTDLSLAGKGAGLGTEFNPTARSGLWFEYLRLIEETRPEFVIIENVPPLRSRGLDVVLGGISALGYDAWWDGLSASAIGAPHQRDRIWIVAHAYSGSGQERTGTVAGRGAVAQATTGGSASQGDSGTLSDSDRFDVGPRRPGRSVDVCPRSLEPVRPMAHADGITERQPGYSTETVSDQRDSRLVVSGSGDRFSIAAPAPFVADANGARLAFWQGFRSNLEQELAATQRDCVRNGGVWYAEPNLGRVVDGTAARLVGPGKDAVARATWEAELKALGNSLVSQIPEAIGRAIIRSVSA